MKTLINESLTGKDLTKFLLDNKEDLVSQKKSMIKRTSPVSSVPSLFSIKGEKAIKTAIGSIEADATSIRVKVVANTALYMDSQQDVLIPDCWKSSIKTRKGMIPHLHDHVHEIGAEVGEVVDIYSQDISLTDLGLTKTGKTQCLIFETDIKKSYNEVVFNKYKAGKINQHSIGLQYVKMELAINDEESEKEFDFWKKYIKQIINKDYAEEKGFFWVIQEIKLLENSCVLFASNELTPTLDVKADTMFQPEEFSTETKPLPSTDEKDTSNVICQNCMKSFDVAINPADSNLSVKCPSCGQYVTQSGAMIIPFDLSKAIRETTFIK